MEKPEKKKPRTSLEAPEVRIEDGDVETEARTHYYVSNFLLVVNDVMERYAALFTSEEVAIITTWQGLAYAAKQLYVRLFSRKVRDRFFFFWFSPY